MRASHTTSLPCRVCSLCSSAPSFMDGQRASDTSLNAACSWMAPNTTVSHSSSSISSNQSHSSSSQLPHALRPNEGGWPHTAVKQDCRKVTHTSLVTIRPPASSCQLRRDTPRRSTPLRRAGFTHVTGLDDSSLVHFESRNLPRALKVEAPRRVGRIKFHQIQTNPWPPPGPTPPPRETK
jgi:hypothetical protein